MSRRTSWHEIIITEWRRSMTRLPRTGSGLRRSDKKNGRANRPTVSCFYLAIIRSRYQFATVAPKPTPSIAAAIAAASRLSPEHVTEPFVTSSTVTPGNSAKAALILPPQPLGHFMPVTSKLTVVEASCVSVSGSTVDVAAGSELSESAGAVLSLLGCFAQPTASSIKIAARCFSFIGPLSIDGKHRRQPLTTHSP